MNSSREITDWWLRIPSIKLIGAQLRAACALLNMSADDLADATNLSRGTIQRAELEAAVVTASNMKRIIETLEENGVVFIPAVGGGQGVRLKEPIPVPKHVAKANKHRRRPKSK